ncbi:MAG: RNase adapter RapZ [Sphingomonadaceae bacterium]
MASPRPRQLLIVTGMSGAGKSTALRTLEDLGWEVVDNLPLRLLERLLAVPVSASGEGKDRPLAIGMDSRTRNFDPANIISYIHRLREQDTTDAGLFFLDCKGIELARRFSETRRLHPLAQDRPMADGIARERELLAPLRLAANHLIDTTDINANELQQEIRSRFGAHNDASPVLTMMSFGFARGVPRNADLMFDMRFLRNPHWVPALKPLTGRDEAVGDYIAEDPAYAEAMERIEGLLQLLLPRYASEGKSYVTVAFGCTGGQHRSVHICECIATRMRKMGFSPTVSHRDLGQRTDKDLLERDPEEAAE